MLVVLAISAGAQTTSPVVTNARATCSPDAKSGLPPCPVTPKDRKRAQREYKEGLKHRDKNRIAEALEHFKLAAQSDPSNADYITARELTRQQLVRDALERGNKALQTGDRVRAMAEFRTALELDPEDEFVRQRVRDILGEIRLRKVEVVRDAPGPGPIRISPQAGSHNFHVRGNTRELLEQVCRAYGLTAFFDDTVVSRPVRFDVQNVDFTTAVDAAARVTKTFYVPLSARQLYFLSDTQQNRQSYERMVTRTFYIREASSPQELSEMMNMLRVMFDIRFVVQQPSNGTMTVRAPALVIEAATKFLESLSEGRPQVMFDIQVFEVSRSFTRQVGVDIPLEFQVFNVPTEAQKLLGGRNIQDIINELIAKGLINQGNTTAIAALVAQFLGQSQSPLIGNTLLLFGGGITQSAIPLPPATVRLSQNQSDVRNLQDVTLRAGHGSPAILKIGSRVPIINATFAPIFNSAALSQVIGDQSYQAPIPSFQYEDVGINVKATPLIRRDSGVTVDLEMQIRSIGTQNLNGVPVISNREYKGTISVQDGEKIVVAGMLNQQEQRGVRGVPLLSRAPVVGRIVSSENIQEQNTELLIVLTPRILRVSEPRGPLEIPIPAAAGR